MAEVPLLASLLEAAPATPARAAALEALRREGLPQPRDEAWKYTPLRALAQRRYQGGDTDAASRAMPADLFLPLAPGPRLVFVNGSLRADLSTLDWPPGVEATLLGEQPEALESLLAADRTGGRAEAFVHLNTLLSRDGLKLTVAPGATPAAPLQLVFVGAPAAAALAWHARVRLELEAGAALTVAETHIGTGAHQNLGNLVLEARLGAGARLALLQMQDAAEGAPLVRRSAFELAADAVLDLYSLELGAQLMRHDLIVSLQGEGARFHSRGAFLVHGRQHADTRVDVRHQAGNTACDIDWRGVAADRARGIFYGGITIDAGADGTDATLSNKNLLLSDRAEIATQPALEIHADEVKAAHGATVGQLDEQALFYLRSRGIAADEARRMLIAAFCEAVFERLQPEALRHEFARRIAARLPAGAA